MNSVVFVVLIISLVALAAGVTETPSYSMKVLPTFKSTINIIEDFLIIDNYLANCPAALTHTTNCLAQNNHNPNPIGDAEICRMSILELNCLDGAFAATTCPGEQAAIDATARIRRVVESTCAALGSASTYAATSFFTVILMVCVNLHFNENACGKVLRNCETEWPC